MKTLHLTNGYPNRKFPTYCIFIKEQVDSLTKAGIENSVFVINPKKIGTLGYLSGYFRLLFFLLKNSKFDIYHCHHILSAFLIICTNPFKKRKIILAFLNDTETELKNLTFPKWFSKWLYKFVVNRVDDFIVKNSVNTTINGKTVYYLPNGVNIELFKPLNKKLSRSQLGLPKDKILILFVSAIFIREQKRYDRFCKVMSILKEKYNLDVEEVLMINEPREKIPLFFNACDIHLLTSDYEGSPNSVKEAMSCNMPIISTNVGNVTDLFTDVSNCIMSETFKAEELAQKCFDLYQNKSVSNSRKRIIEIKLDINSVANKLKDIYHSMIYN